MFKPRLEEEDKDDEIFMEMELVEEEDKDEDKGKKKRNTITRFKQRSQEEREALFKDRSIKRKQVDTIELENIVNDSYDNDELSSLKGSDAKDVGTEVFPKFNEEAKFGEVRL